MVRRVTLYSDHFRMVGAANDNNVAVLLGGACCELLNAGDERARRIDNLRCFFFKFLLNLRSYTMSADNGCLAAFYLNRIADRRDTLFAQPLHLLFVMDERAEASHSVAALERVLAPSHGPA